MKLWKLIPHKHKYKEYDRCKYITRYDVHYRCVKCGKEKRFVREELAQ